MQKITPFLWFDTQAEEAMKFYTSIFKNSKVGRITQYGDAGPGPKGTAMSVTFELEGQEFMALNGGPVFKFSQSLLGLGFHELPSIISTRDSVSQDSKYLLRRRGSYLYRDYSSSVAAPPPSPAVQEFVQEWRPFCAA